jgi:hypothetical protein
VKCPEVTEQVRKEKERRPVEEWAEVVNAAEAEEAQAREAIVCARVVAKKRRIRGAPRAIR